MLVETRFSVSVAVIYRMQCFDLYPIKILHTKIEDNETRTHLIQKYFGKN